MIVPVYRKSVVLLQIKLNLALKYCDYLSRVETIIVNSGGYCDDREDRTSTIFSTLQTRINTITRSDGNYTHNTNDASSKNNDNSGDSGRYRRIHGQLWVYTRYLPFLADSQRGPCLNFGAKAACR